MSQIIHKLLTSFFFILFTNCCKYSFATGHVAAKADKNYYLYYYTTDSTKNTAELLEEEAVNKGYVIELILKNAQNVEKCNRFIETYGENMLIPTDNGIERRILI